MCEDRQKTSKAGSSRSTSSRKPAKTTRPSRPSRGPARLEPALAALPRPRSRSARRGTRATHPRRGLEQRRVVLVRRSARPRCRPPARPAGTPSAAQRFAPARRGQGDRGHLRTPRGRDAAGRPSASSTRAMARLTAITRPAARGTSSARADRASEKSTRRVATRREARGPRAAAAAAASACGSCSVDHVRPDAAERAGARPRAGAAQKSPSKPRGRTSRPAACARSRSAAPPSGRPAMTSCPRAAMPARGQQHLVLSAPPAAARCPRAAILIAPGRRAVRAVRGAWPASRRCSTRSAWRR